MRARGATDRLARHGHLRHPWRRIPTRLHHPTSHLCSTPTQARPARQTACQLKPAACCTRVEERPCARPRGTDVRRLSSRYRPPPHGRATPQHVLPQNRCTGTPEHTRCAAESAAAPWRCSHTRLPHRGIIFGIYSGAHLSAINHVASKSVRLAGGCPCCERSGTAMATSSPLSIAA